VINKSIPSKLLAFFTLSCAFFLFGNGIIPLTDPDEVFYAETAKEMTQRGEWLTPYIFDQPQFEKPIFIYWAIMVASKLLGEGPFAARFFPAIFAALGVMAVYGLGLLGFRDERRAFWSALVLCTAGLYIGMGKTVFTDMIFTVFILYSLLSFYLAFKNPSYKIFGVLGFYVFAALAVLTKGPLGLIIPMGTVILFLMYQRKLYFMADRWFLIGLLLCMALALPWYVTMFRLHGNAFVHEFFYNDHWRRLIEAEHRTSDRWYFYPLTIIGGFFPWNFFAVAALIVQFKKFKQGTGGFEHFLLCWILTVFLIFQVGHSKLASYILPLFPAMALLIGGYIEDLLQSRKHTLIKIGAGIPAGLLCILGIGALLAHPIYQRYFPSMLPIYFFSAVSIVWAGGIGVFLMKNAYANALKFMAFVFVPLICAGFLLHEDIEPYVSVEDVSQYLPNASGQKMMVMTSKHNARGIKYYTGQEVAILEMGGANYFSPHPIRLFSDMPQLVEFLRSRPYTYAVIKKWHDSALVELPKGQFKVEVLNAVGPDYVIRISPAI